MAVQVSEQSRVGERIATSVRPSRRRSVKVAAVLVVAALVGATGAVLAYRTTNDGRTGDVVAAQRIQEQRAQAMIADYQERWASERSTPAGAQVSPIRVTGTGPGLVHVAERRAGYDEPRVTGTGPGLEHLGADGE